ncbi:hypothetical protein K503DRAFT_866606 [Rhizopogon vinicolor AM-OR11-026]|uniref:Cwf19-like C-terminal domain-containing protein n=1 Tax=Rhizopogon vinicolor AM-OR11-026 TaxID=1314800 RepID=A0A1B7MYX5_9AGAM|nr:hypothetical protein K503DRAFT_866606 [Rhizopogon vinicolor AM-OR11-026]
MGFNIIRFPPLAGFLLLVTFHCLLSASLLLSTPSIIPPLLLAAPTFLFPLPFQLHNIWCRLVLKQELKLVDDYGESSSSRRPPGGDVDFFSSLGTERKRPPQSDKPNPDDIKGSSKELSQYICASAGRLVDQDVPHLPPKAITHGDPGSSWRMMRLRRVYKTAKEENKLIEQVTLKRFGTLQAFEEAKAEWLILDEGDGKRSQCRDKRCFVPELLFQTSSSGSTGSTPSTPSPANPPTNQRLDSLHLPSRAAFPRAQSHTPISTVMTPSVATTSTRRTMSPSSLNKLQAQVLRAKLMSAHSAGKLQEEYEAEVRRTKSEGSGIRTRMEVLPTLNVMEQMYDGGHGKNAAEEGPGNRPKKGESFASPSARLSTISWLITLREMVRQERFGAGMADQKNLDAQFAKAIMGFAKFQNDLDYMDDNAERLGRQKMRSDAMKRQFAVHDYKRTQKVLATCQFCYGEDDTLPKAPIVAMGTRAYLSCTLNEELLDRHCLIADDDVWDEVLNFMKSLMRMFGEEDKGVVFYEAVVSLKSQKHTWIECIPLPWEKFDDIPAYFKESILASEAEWSTHRILIDFSARPGGFRRAMVPDLPYFMLQFDRKGEKGGTPSDVIIYDLEDSVPPSPSDILINTKYSATCKLLAIRSLSIMLQDRLLKGPRMNFRSIHMFKIRSQTLNIDIGHFNSNILPSRFTSTMLYAW